MSAYFLDTAYVIAKVNSYWIETVCTYKIPTTAKARR